MGGGDWNDGMNLVGRGGNGESVWLAWFLTARPRRSARRRRASATTHARRAWRRAASSCAARVERQAWDGVWYRRAYFDDGTPLGSVPARSAGSIRSRSPGRCSPVPASPRAPRARWPAVEEYLLRREDELLLLFTPPFDRTRAGSRLHQGLPAGRSRERRPVHPRGGLGGARVRGAGDGDRAVGLRAAESDPAHGSRAGLIATSVEPYVVAPTSTRHPACRARRLDLVHRIRRLAVPRGARVGSGCARARRHTVRRPCVPRGSRSFEVVLRRRAARWRSRCRIRTACHAA